MNIALDFGNSFIKAGFYSGKSLTEVKTLDNSSDLLRLLKEINPENVVLTDVTGQKSAEIIAQISSIYNTLIVDNKTKIPIINRYLSPETLGADRLCAAVGASAVYKNANVLNIDTGTCIKYNFVNNKNEFLGGAISPGIQMRYKALNAFTGKLPLLEPDYNSFLLIGQNTQESIHSGVLFNTMAEIVKVIEYYAGLFEGLKIVVSGGDTEFLAKHLKNTIFAHPNLVLTGLNEILHYNINK